MSVIDDSVVVSDFYDSSETEDSNTHANNNEH